MKLREIVKCWNECINQKNILTLYQHQQHSPTELEHRGNAFYFCLLKQQQINLPCSFVESSLSKRIKFKKKITNDWRKFVLERLRCVCHRICCQNTSHLSFDCSGSKYTHTHKRHLVSVRRKFDTLNEFHHLNSAARVCNEVNKLNR